MPATDEVWRLQRNDDSDCVMFRRMVRGHDAPSRGTMQGFYVFSPGGALLGRRNSRRVDGMVRMLEQALARWEALPGDERRLPKGTDVTPKHRWEDSYPEDGLVLTSTVRDIPPDADPRRRRRQPFNRNPVWFSKSEARRWLPGEPVVGVKHDVPRLLVDRLARFSLVDTVRGQSLAFDRADVAGSSMTSEVIARDGDVVRLRIRGTTKAEADAAGGRDRWPRALDTHLLGLARYDLKTGRFLEFDLVALGIRTGGTQFNSRRNNPGPSRVGFLFRLARPGWRVPPAFVNVYDVGWVKQRER